METPRHAGDVMRRVRSLEGLLDDASGGSADGAQEPEFNPAASRAPQVTTTPVIKETPRYARDPTTTATTAAGSQFRMRNPNAEFSPWDEDKLWRDKLRRASIRHTRSMDMLDEIQHNRKPGRSRAEEIAPLPEEESGCYERLVQYSATLERAKRGQTYLDGYLWDELEQRFRRPESGYPETSNHFLEDSLPPFEIDREKLRQWDLLSTAAPIEEGGRRPLGPTTPNSEAPAGNEPDTTKQSTTDAEPMEPVTAQPSDPKAYGRLTNARADVRLARQVQTRPPGGHSSSSQSPEGDALISPRGLSSSLHWLGSSPDPCHIKCQSVPRASVAKMSPQRPEAATTTAVTPPAPPSPPPAPPPPGKMT